MRPLPPSVHHFVAVQLRPGSVYHLPHSGQHAGRPASGPPPAGDDPVLPDHGDDGLPGQSRGPVIVRDRWPPRRPIARSTKLGKRGKKHQTADTGGPIMKRGPLRRITLGIVVLSVLFAFACRKEKPAPERRARGRNRPPATQEKGARPATMWFRNSAVVLAAARTRLSSFIATGMASRIDPAFGVDHAQDWTGRCQSVFPILDDEATVKNLTLFSFVLSDSCTAPQDLFGDRMDEQRESIAHRMN